MLFELDRENFNKVNNLFIDLEYCLSVFSVTSGKNAGRIFVNDSDNMTSAIVISTEGMYLGGEFRDSEFFKGINNVLKNDIYKSYKDGDKPCYTLFYPSKEWESSVKTMLLDLYPMKDNRYYLEMNIGEFKAEGFSKNVVKIDYDLLQNSELDEIDDIRERIIDSYDTFENFLKNGFGFLYIIGNKIVSSCITDCVVGDRCEFGVETHEDYRRKGYCIETVKAALCFCKDNGIKRAGWHCWEYNTASYRLAEKAGFKILKEIDVYFAWYDLNANNLINGNQFIRKEKNYLLAAEFYSKAFEKGYGYNWQYFNAACAYFKINKIDEAQRCYKTARDKGWKGINEIKDTWFYMYVYKEEDVYSIEENLKAIS